MILLYFKRTLLVAAACVAVYGLAERLGPMPALLAWSVFTAAACALGAVSLRSSPVGRVTWRNHLAGYLIPWGWRLNRGRLWPLPAISWAVWLAIGMAAVTLRPGEAGIWTRAGLFAAWAVDAAALVYLLGTITQATPGGRVGSVWKLVAVVAGLIAASVGLFLAGRTDLALLVGGGPPAVALGVFGLVILVLVTVGRNVRWN